MPQIRWFRSLEDRPATLDVSPRLVLAAVEHESPERLGDERVTARGMAQRVYRPTSKESAHAFQTHRPVPPEPITARGQVIHSPPPESTTYSVDIVQSPPPELITIRVHEDPPPPPELITIRVHEDPPPPPELITIRVHEDPPPPQN